MTRRQLFGYASIPPWLLAAALAAIWLVVAPRTPDLAAQVYRAGLFAREGFAVWDNAWYAGHHLPGYSLLFPPLGALLGPRTVGVITALTATVLFDRLARGHFGERARLGTAWFAAASIADLCIGRLTFSLGVAIGLGALRAWQCSRPRTAVVLAGLCAAGSPVAGAFLALAAAAAALTGVRPRQAAAIAGSAMGVVLALSIVFPEGGRQPFALLPMLAVVGFSVALVAALPTEERTLRIGAGLYAVAAVAAFFIATPMGSNATRLGAMFAGPLLACGIAGVVLDTRRRRLLVTLAAALCAWQWYAPAREIAISVGDQSLQGRYYHGLIGFLQRNATIPGRVEVPFTRGHWEAVHLAQRFPLARGWETQLDTKYDELFFQSGGPGVNAYRTWLRRNAVRFVAVPDAPLDRAGRAEAHLIAMGLPYLRPVWADAHWRVYRMTDPLALVSGPARLLKFNGSGFTLQARREGWIGVRVHYTSYWQTAGAPACVSMAPHGWTRIYALAPGRIAVRASFTADRIASSGPSCRRAVTKPGWG